MRQGRPLGGGELLRSCAPGSLSPTPKLTEMPGSPFKLPRIVAGSFTKSGSSFRVERTPCRWPSVYFRSSRPSAWRPAHLREESLQNQNTKIPTGLKENNTKSRQNPKAQSSDIPTSITLQRSHPVFTRSAWSFTTRPSPLASVPGSGSWRSRLPRLPLDALELGDKGTEPGFKKGIRV